jgi:hypothetical protein
MTSAAASRERRLALTVTAAVAAIAACKLLVHL